MRPTLQEMANTKNAQPFFKNDWYIEEMPVITYNGKDYVLPKYLVQSIDMSSIKFESLPVFSGATNNFYPGDQDVGGPSLNVVDNIELEGMSYFTAWLDTIKNADSTYNMPDTFKRTLKMILMDCTGRLLKRISFVGIWPDGGISFGFDESGGTFGFSVAFSMDSLSIETLI